MAGIAAMIEGVKAGRKLLTLLVVMGVAGGLYVRGEIAAHDRDGLTRWGDQACEAAGAPFRPEGVKKRAWGAACLGEIRRLAQVEKDLKQGSLDALLADLERREGREAADAALAAAMSKRTAQVVARMEAADAAVEEDDRVGPGWAAAVNELGGLRDDRR
ncbi:hypothetical protein [Brevundimonas sp.]|uniref:hypothetical protein n=1 Tax=Brevundimonas sp. TaxID=1871086 RepID=UPI0028992850|nr:hypothetical protein [Brevundimonas sp.]